jgi:tetratricopeptide (TPR) repeat protein
VPEATGGGRLSDLESRWRFDRSPRVFLQLADELRKAGSLARAIEVLQEGLTHHPESVSGRVALGRAQLEAGDASAAAETLERVLTRDPAQIVASKLLIETWIRMGDAVRARERLDIYRILQERDSEIDAYEHRIAAMERSQRLPAVYELAGVAVPGAGEEAGRAPEPLTAAAGQEEPLFDLGAARERPPLELLPELEPRPAATAAASPASRLTSFGAEGPFGQIHEPRASGARILDFFRSEALFVVPAAVVRHAEMEPTVVEQVAVEPALAESAPAESPIAEPDNAEPNTAAPFAAAQAGAPLSVHGAVAAGALEALASTDREALSAADEAPEPAPALLEPQAPAPLPGGMLAPGMSFEQFSTTGFAAEVERESLVEPLAAVLGRAGIDAEALPGIVHPENASALRAKPVDVSAVESAPFDGVSGALEPSAVAFEAVSIEAVAETPVPATFEARAESAAPESPAPTAAAPEPPSATLAGLYLEQGHLAEAEAEYRRVLSSQPDNEAALAGLRQVARRRASEDTISGWSAAEPAAPAPAPAPPRPHRAVGLTQRKVETLRDYLARIRRGRTRSHVS